MPTFTDEGIVLRRVNYGEADRILTVMTRDSGKIGVIARGVRKPRAKSAAQTDLFVRSTMQLAQSRGQLHVLTQAAAVLPVLACSDPVRLACAGACAELVDRALEGEHPDPQVYELLGESLAEILSEGHDARMALVWFVQRLLDRLGYAPQLTECANCHKRLPEQTATFIALSGGLVCRECSRGTWDGVACPVPAIKVLRIAAAADHDTFIRLKIGADVLRDLERVVEAELEAHLGKRLRAFDMLHSFTAR